MGRMARAEARLLKVAMTEEKRLIKKLVAEEQQLLQSLLAPRPVARKP